MNTTSYRIRAAVLLVGLLVGGICGGYVMAYTVYAPRLADKQVEIDRLRSEVLDMNLTVSALESQIDGLVTRVSELTTLKNRLDAENKLLEQKWAALQDDYDYQKEQRVGNTLGTYYDWVRYEYAPMDKPETPTLSPTYWKPKADFAVDLVRHDLGWLYWPLLDDQYIHSAGETSCTTALRKLDSAMASVGIMTTDNSSQKIAKILAFVNRYISFENDINDLFMAPSETLAHRSGDCDDFTILVAAMFEYLGIDSAIGFFFNEAKQFHAMVLVHMDSLDYPHWSYDDLTRMGLQKGKWIKIEPQSHIEDQGTDRIRDWYLIVAKQITR